MGLNREKRVGFFFCGYFLEWNRIYVEDFVRGREKNFLVVYCIIFTGNNRFEKV